VFLLDEPTSGLDPISTNKVENSLQKLKKKYTTVLVFPGYARENVHIGFKLAMYFSWQEFYDHLSAWSDIPNLWYSSSIHLRYTRNIQHKSWKFEMRIFHSPF